MKSDVKWRKAMISSLVLAALSGCAMNLPGHQESVDKSQKLMEQGDAKGALQTLSASLKKVPDNAEVKIEFDQALTRYKRQELLAAQDAMDQNQLDQARAHIDNILQYDPHDMRSQQLLSELKVSQRLAGVLSEAQKLAASNPQAALLLVNKVLEERRDFPGALDLQRSLQQATSDMDALQPQLSPELYKPISLTFRDQRIMDIFETISRVSGVNFVFDRDVPSSLTTSLYANNTTVNDAINLLVATNGLARKVLNKNTLLIYPRQPNKVAEYQDMVVKTFYLSNADPKQVFNALRQTLDSRNIYIDERLNAIVMRGTAGEIDVASRLINSLDLPQSEVTLDVSVMEIDKTGALNLGLLLPGTLGFSPGDTTVNGSSSTSGSGATAFANSIVRKKLGIIGFDGKSMLNLQAQEKNGHVRILSNPKIRVRNREKATIKVGGQVPILTNTTSGTGTVSQSANYQDIGLTLTVTPNISLTDELSVHVQLEISDVQNTNKSNDGTLVYEFTRRSADTTMTARDNQTQVLGGLISYKTQMANAGLPGLRTLFGIGKLFGQDTNSDDDKQIVLLITPHIDRSLQLPSASTATFVSGTLTQANTNSPLILRDGSSLTLPPANGGSTMPQAYGNQSGPYGGGRSPGSGGGNYQVNGVPYPGSNGPVNPPPPPGGPGPDGGMPNQRSSGGAWPVRGMGQTPPPGG